MPIALVRCPYCGAAAESRFRQVALGCDLRWWESFSCQACGVRTEADGNGDLPPDRRAVLIERDGLWSVVAEGSPRVVLLRAVRECLRLSLGEIAVLKARLPGVLATGTRTEMEVLARRLHRAAGTEVAVKVVPG